MKLDLYLYLKKNKITGYKFANEIGVTRERLSAVINGRSKASPMMALAVEKMTNGEITREYMMKSE